MRAFETTIMQKKWESEFDELLKELEQFRKDFAQTKKCTCQIEDCTHFKKKRHKIFGE